MGRFWSPWEGALGRWGLCPEKGTEFLRCLELVFLWFWAGFLFDRELGEKNSDYGAKGEHSVVNFVNFVA